jgi:uncharacterized phage infection (PIP) family protein YhgE
MASGGTGDVSIIINADASKMESEVKRARAELDRLSRAMAQTDDSTGALNTATGEARKKFEEVADAARRAGVDIGKYEDKVEKAEKPTKQLALGVEGLDKSTKVLNGAFGDIFGPLADFTELSEMAGKGTAALAVGAMAVVAGLFALGTATFDVIANIKDYTKSIDRAAKTNMVSQGQVDQLYQANAAVTQAGNAWDMFRTVLATRFAGWFNKFVTGIVHASVYFGQIAEEVFSGNFLGAHEAATAKAAETTKNYLRQREAMAEQVKEEAHATEKSSAAAAKAAPKLKSVADSYRQVADSARKAAEAQSKMPTLEFGDIDPEAIQFAPNLDETIAAYEEAGTRIEQVIDLGQFQLPPLKSADEVLAEQKAITNSLDAIKERASAAGAVFSAVGQGVSGLGSIFEGALELADGASRQVRMRLFTAMKAARISEAVINGAVAITRAFAELGPIGGAVMAPIVGAQTAVQVALITQQRPSFHRGGYLASPSMLSPDEVVIRRNEVPAMMTAQGARTLGQSGLARMNAGEAPATGGGVYVMLDGRRVGTRLFAAPDPTYGMRLAGVY